MHLIQPWQRKRADDPHDEAKGRKKEQTQPTTHNQPVSVRDSRHKSHLNHNSRVHDWNKTESKVVESLGIMGAQYLSHYLIAVLVQPSGLSGRSCSVNPFRFF
jgi:hypothetical protein